MSIAQRRINYISDNNRTDSYISSQTGIPRSTIGFVRRGERTLPTEYEYDLRLVFQREAYGIQRSAGMSFGQARRFSSYSPEANTLKTGIMKDIVNTNTMGGCIQEKLRLEKQGILIEIDDIWYSVKADVEDAYRHSDKTFEEWEKDLT